MRRRLMALLRRVGDLLQVSGAPHARYRPYQEAAYFLQDLEGDVEGLALSGDLWRRLRATREVRAAIEDVLAGREPRALDELSAAPEDFLALPGVPLPYLERIRANLRIVTRKDLGDALTTGELERRDWLPAPIVERIRRALEPRAAPARWPVGEALPAARQLVGALRGMVAPEALSFTGRLRRGAEWIDGIFILAGTEAPGDLHQAFGTLPGLAGVRRLSPDASGGVSEEGPPVELRTVAPRSFGPLLQFYTGSPEHTRKLRAHARAVGCTLRDDRLTRAGARVPVQTEERLYRELGLAVVPPELRRGLGEVPAAREGRLPNLIKAVHLRGDLHVHSDWSDGGSTLAGLAEAAARAGYEWMAVCDHSKSLTFANGLSVSRMEAKLEAVRRLNAAGGPVRLLAGTEVDILPDGSLDYPAHLLAALDLVVAAVHLDLNDPMPKMTRRILRALEEPHVHVLAHPTGRILGSRPARKVDLEAVLAACARRGVAMEVNCHAHRMDPPVHVIERALELGLPLALGSDAHHADQLWMLELGLTQVRRAAAPPGSVLNTLGAAELLVRLRRR